MSLCKKNGAAAVNYKTVFIVRPHMTKTCLNVTFYTLKENQQPLFVAIKKKSIWDWRQTVLYLPKHTYLHNLCISSLFSVGFFAALLICQVSQAQRVRWVRDVYKDEWIREERQHKKEILQKKNYNYFLWIHFKNGTSILFFLFSCIR